MTDPYRAAATPARSTPDSSDPVIRRAVFGDARRIAEICVLGWRAAYRGLLPDDYLAMLSVEARAMAWQESLSRDTDWATPAWVAERNGEVVGYVIAGPPRDEDVPLPAAEVYAIYVLPAAWRSGVGRALLDTAVAEWRSRHVRRIVLWVLEGNARARRFYEAMGWSPDGGRQEIDLGGVSPVEVRYRIEAPGR